jgi:hypothetical protein
MIFAKIVKTSVLPEKHSQLLNLKPGKMDCSYHAKIYGKQQMNNCTSWSID